MPLGNRCAANLKVPVSGRAHAVHRSFKFETAEIQAPARAGDMPVQNVDLIRCVALTAFCFA
jgi:hypothetical protein